MQTIRNHYRTVSAFLAACDKPAHPSWEGKRRSSRDTHNTEWAGGMTYEQAANAAANGWEAGTAEMAGRIQLAQSQGEARGYIPAVAGGFPDVGRYLAGVPDCMRARAQTTRARPCLDIVVNCSFGCNVESSAIMNYGAAIVAAIDSMEAAGLSVSLTAGASGNHTQKTVNDITTIDLKRHGEPLDLGRVAFFIAHTGFYRKLYFSHMETLYTFAALGAGYGKVWEPAPAEGVLYFGSGFSVNKECDTMTSAANYVARTIRKHNPELMAA